MCLQFLKKISPKTSGAHCVFFLWFSHIEHQNFKKNSLSVMQQPDITPGPPVEEKSHCEV
jgi:hypothetical protein